jgi:succinate-semialdehyde dehydrogenase/glutarate-semialdehyde dehydrogenase
VTSVELASATGAGADLPPAVDPAVVRRLQRHVVVGPGAPNHRVVSPFDGRTVAELAYSSATDVGSAFALAAAAQRRWAQYPLRARARVLLRMHDLVLERQAEGLDLAQLETGKARLDAFEELADIALVCRHYARRGPRLLEPHRRTGIFPVLTDVRELRHPLGVVGVISPWNYPLTLAVSDAIPALLAGNAVVLKPDHRTTLTALWAVDLLREAGLPEGVLSVVCGRGEDLGPEVVDRADYVMFTGSTRVGRGIARRCGERLIGCSLELGGKNAMIVRADVDLDRAVEIAWRACFANAGQLCISMERLLVDESVLEQFLHRFVPRVRSLRLRAGLGWGADIGSLISAEQLARVAGHVRDAVDQGAEVLAGGSGRPDIGPYFFEPTVLRGVTEQMALCREETFGPVVSVYPFGTDDEAVRLANDSGYGLNAAVLTRDVGAGRAMAGRIRAGTVNVNDGYGATWGSTAAPMGGMKDSGLGRRHGAEGLLKFTEPQAVAVQHLIGFGPALGLTDRQWAGLLTTGIRAMKQLGRR